MDKKELVKFIAIVGCAAVAVLAIPYWILSKLTNGWISTLIIAWVLNWIIKTFINFNVFRAGGFIPKRMLESSISKQLARSIEAQINGISNLLKQLDSKGGSGVRHMHALKKTVEKAYQVLTNQLEVMDRLEADKDPKVYSKHKKVFHAALRAWFGSLRKLKIRQKGNNYFVKNVGDVLKDLKSWSFTFSSFELTDDSYMAYAEHKTNTEAIRAILGGCISQEGYINQFNNFLYNDTVGSVDEMKIQLEINYPAHRFSFKPNKSSKIDCMAVCSIKRSEWNNDSVYEDKRQFLRRVFDRNNDSGASHQLMTEIDDLDSFRGNHVKKVVIICQPNAAVYELSCFEHRVLDFYLVNGFTVIYWNYRGYGRSTGIPSMSNLRSDGEKLVELVREKLQPEKVVVHGRSLGGHVAKSLASTVDLVICDRTFSSISFVPRTIMGNFIQKVFDLYTNNYRTYTEKLINAETPKIFFFDPNDEIITLQCSIVTHLSAHLSNIFFKMKPPKNPEAKIYKYPPLNLLNRLNNISAQNQIFEQMHKIIKASASELLDEKDQLLMFCAAKRLMMFKFTLHPSEDDAKRTLRTRKRLVRTMEREAVFKENFGANFEDDSIEDIESDYLKNPEYSYLQEFEGLEIMPDIFEALDDVLTAVCMVESASMSFSDVYAADEGDRLLAFQVLLVNFAIWGSYYPKRKLLSSDYDVRDPCFNMSLSLENLMTVLKKLSKSRMKLQKTASKSEEYSPLCTLLIRDIRILETRTQTLLSNLSKQLQKISSNELKRASSTLSTHYKDDNSLMTEDTMDLNSSDEGNTSILQDNINRSDKSITKAEYLKLRKRMIMIPVSCGHNGVISQQDMDLFERLLSELKFIN